MQKQLGLITNGEYYKNLPHPYKKSVIPSFYL